MEGAQSELIVPSAHPAHQNPQAIVEVHRILKLNARSSHRHMPLKTLPNAPTSGFPSFSVNAHASDDRRRWGDTGGCGGFLAQNLREQTLVSAIQSALRRGRQDENGQMDARTLPC